MFLSHLMLWVCLYMVGSSSHAGTWTSLTPEFNHHSLNGLSNLDLLPVLARLVLCTVQYKHGHSLACNKTFFTGNNCLFLLVSVPPLLAFGFPYSQPFSASLPQPPPFSLSNFYSLTCFRVCILGSRLKTYTPQYLNLITCILSYFPVTGFRTVCFMCLCTDLLIVNKNSVCGLSALPFCWDQII